MIPLALGFSNVIAQSRDQCHTIPFVFPIHLGVVCGSSVVIQLKEVPYGFEELAYSPGAIVNH